jgi:hypothetical protein
MKIPLGTRIKLTIRTGSELINLKGTVTEDQVPFNTYAAASVHTLDYKPCGLDKLFAEKNCPAAVEFVSDITSTRREIATIEECYHHLNAHRHHRSRYHPQW